MALDVPSPFLAAGTTGAGEADQRRIPVPRPKGEFRLAFSTGSFDRFVLPEIPEELAALAKRAGVDLKPGPCIMPSPIRRSLVMGAGNGIGTRDRNESPEKALTRFAAVLARDGQIDTDPVEVIPSWAKPKGSRCDGYRVKWAAAHSGAGDAPCDHYDEVWNVPTRIDANGNMRWVFDHDSHALWIAWLLCRAVIKAADEDRVDAKRSAAADLVRATRTTRYETPEAAALRETERKARQAAAHAPVLGREPMQAA